MKYDIDRYSGDPSISWLKKYLHQGLDKWPSDAIINELLVKFGNDERITIYRGMNFRSKDEWNKFMNDFDGKRYKVNGISSWSPDKLTAQQFAHVRPTYFPDKETFEQERTAREDNEKLRGYRGVIIKSIVEPHSVIDIRKSGVGYENEVLLPTGTYDCEIIDVIKPYRETVENGEVDINQRNYHIRSGSPQSLDITASCGKKSYGTRSFLPALLQRKPLLGLPRTSPLAKWTPLPPLRRLRRKLETQIRTALLRVPLRTPVLRHGQYSVP